MVGLDYIPLMPAMHTNKDPVRSQILSFGQWDKLSIMVHLVRIWTVQIYYGTLMTVQINITLCVKYLKVSNDIVHTLNIIIYATQNSTSAISKVESYIPFRNSPVFEEEVVCPFFLWPFFFCPSSIYGF